MHLGHLGIGHPFGLLPGNRPALQAGKAWMSLRPCHGATVASSVVPDSFTLLPWSKHQLLDCCEQGPSRSSQAIRSRSRCSFSSKILSCARCFGLSCRKSAHAALSASSCRFSMPRKCGDAKAFITQSQGHLDWVYLKQTEAVGVTGTADWPLIVPRSRTRRCRLGASTLIASHDV